ncbi:MAG: PAS domain-containing protein, partial [Bacteroidales bacterium]|nr:PAS domain-containing protein [Bacteroidales bacterium]
MVGTINSIILESLLETLPMEFSIIDKNDKVLAWNKHETRLFKRPVGVVGKDVRNCHPKHSLDKVEQLLHEMKKGTREKA